ncbi:MAG: M48 family metalloprotease, partial [Rhodospirillaceae bacterium]|nr:M48 family metalloprotease [Rhodospirillaceae bacterium]
MTDASFQFFGKVAQRATMLAGAIIIVLAIIIPEFANAQNAKPLRIVRDSETEHIIRTMATPLFSAAGLDPESVKIILVEDNTLNAFVSGGMNIFIHTGLITQSESPEALIGVLAHETGHIQGGHLVRGRDAMEQARTIGTITAILGTAAAIGSGRGDVAGAAIMGGQSIATRSFLKFSRTQESAADHAAFRLLDATNTTATGLEKFLEKLKDQDLMPARFQDPYMLTHPLNTQRIAAIKEHIKNSPNSNANVPDKTRDDFDMIVAKLFGFLNPFDQVLRRYPESDGSIPARYAR